MSTLTHPMTASVTPQSPDTQVDTQVNPAGFVPRLAAYLTDTLVVLVLSSFYGFLIGLLFNHLTCGLQVLLLGAGVLGACAYYPYFWVRSGQTPGKRLLHLKVVRCDGQPLSWGTAIGRYLGYIVSALPLYLGFLWILWDRNKQGFHDKIAGTVVVRTCQPRK
jgi:uncharacterized RDD family membrane protein YckC